MVGISFVFINNEIYISQLLSTVSYLILTILTHQSN